MSEADNPAITVEQSRVESVYVERLFNLGNYENIKYGLRVAVAQGDDPGRVLVSLENILNDLRASSGVSDWALERAKRELPELEAKKERGEALIGVEIEQLEDYRDALRKAKEAGERRRKARWSLSTLNYTSERKDNKEDWVDDDDLVHPEDCGEIAF